MRRIIYSLIFILASCATYSHPEGLSEDVLRNDKDICEQIAKEASQEDVVVYRGSIWRSLAYAELGVNPPVYAEGRVEKRINKPIYKSVYIGCLSSYGWIDDDEDVWGEQNIVEAPSVLESVYQGKITATAGEGDRAEGNIIVEMKRFGNKIYGKWRIDDDDYGTLSGLINSKWIDIIGFSEICTEIFIAKGTLEDSRLTIYGKGQAFPSCIFSGEYEISGILEETYR